MKQKISLPNLLNFIILFDLIFGGSGRLITVGRISFRTILFAFAMAYVLWKVISGKGTFELHSLLLILCFVAYLIFNVFVIGKKPLSQQIDFLTRYLYIVLVFFYEVYFSRKFFGSLNVIRRQLNNLIYVFAVFSIFLWLLSFVLGSRAYDIVEMRFFRPYVYGSFDFIGGRIPRVFMKSSIFVPIGLLFQLEDYLSRKSGRYLFRTCVCGIALITTFTTGLFLATLICVILLLHHKNILSRKSSLVIVGGLTVVTFASFRFGLFDLMLSRYTGNYTTSYRTIQMKSILKEFIQKPLLGHGFGYEFTTYYGDSVRTTQNFEISWGEMLVDIGLIGFVLFTSHILMTLRRLRILSRQNDRYYVLGLGILVICLESFTNPFINNSIGLTYYAICAGLANVMIRRKGLIEFEEFA